jgi:hypothetical protein
MYGQMDKEKTGLIVAENAVDVIQDAVGFKNGNLKIEQNRQKKY